jgi:rubredoxin-NAD+ reductase
MAHPVIIIGAGLAGWTTVREFRKLDSTTPVIVVTADSGDFYAKPTLSNAYAQKRTPEQLVSTPAAKMVETLNITLWAHTQVSSIDTATHSISFTRDGVTQNLTYRQLVLATGAKPIRVPIQGEAAEQVLSVNSLDDFNALYSRLSPGSECASSSKNESRTIVIMGAGLIGCEFANDLVQAGHTVHVADPSARPLAALLPAGAGDQLARAMSDLGVQWHFGTTVHAVDPLDGPSRVDAQRLRVSLSDGNVVQADVVLSAIGLRSDTRLVAAAGIACERGIVVDTQLQTSAPEVYALGDCAQYASAGQRVLPYVMPVMGAAKVLAANLAGTPTTLAFPLMPVSIKTPALPIVICAAHPELAGQWVADDEAEPGVWRFSDDAKVQRGFVLSGKQTARRMELLKGTVL